jgi:hypothetical protein
MRRIARPPTPQLSSRYDSRATHARKLLPEAQASVPFGCVLVRVRSRDAHKATACMLVRFRADLSIARVQ